MAVDHKIIEECIAGNRRAQSKLYKKYAAGMLGVCLRYSKNKEEAEDILQDGFIKVFTNIKKLKDYYAVEGWIKRIMVNTAITYFKKKKIYFENIDDIEFAENTEEEAFYPVDAETLMKVIQHLPIGYRTVLNLYVFESYTHREIANLLGISENTSKTQLMKARRHIKSKLLEINKVKTHHLST
ncbi:MAG: sigma-70 family RNA polymerase sigma factor [Bacteroidales bacterium]